jgi:ABC-type antimicrobial peptide transport system permease subunit
MSVFLVILRLGLHDLFRHRRLVLIMSISIAIATAMYAFLVTYRTGLAAEFEDQTTSLLAVHDNQNVGDISGSRISSQVAEMLSGLGISMIIPEIHAITGTSIQNATLLRGIDLEQYTRLEGFAILSGRSLKPGDSSRLAMVGVLLAGRQDLKAGDSISLRGRDFTIAGIFQNGTYMDNQAWISLTDAQVLLDWGQDVSVYIIPDEGILHEGDTLPGGLSVTRKGENLRLIAAQYQPMLNIWQIVSLALGLGVSLTLANVLWRLAWLRRHEMAILRTTGFPTPSLIAYLLVQAGGITLLGILLGGLFTVAFFTGVHLTVSSFTIVPRLDAGILLPGLGWIGLIMLAGSLLPAWWLGHLNLAQLLHSK